MAELQYTHTSLIRDQLMRWGKRQWEIYSVHFSCDFPHEPKWSIFWWWRIKEKNAEERVNKNGLAYCKCEAESKWEREWRDSARETAHKPEWASERGINGTDDRQHFAFCSSLSFSPQLWTKTKIQHGNSEFVSDQEAWFVFNSFCIHSTGFFPLGFVLHLAFPEVCRKGQLNAVTDVHKRMGKLALWFM